MHACEERNFSCDTSVVACTAEDMSNSCVAHIEAKLISTLAKWSSKLFLSSSNYKVFVSISELRGTTRTWMIFGRAHCKIFVHDALSCAIFQTEVQSSLSNNLPTKDSANKQVFSGRIKLMLTGFWCRHENNSIWHND
jgi:hypothetical protein